MAMVRFIRRAEAINRGGSLAGAARGAAVREPGPIGAEVETAEACQELGSEKQACAFTSQLQFHGWTIENHDPSCQEFRLACHL
jgi:hypothetical protein